VSAEKTNQEKINDRRTFPHYAVELLLLSCHLKTLPWQLTTEEVLRGISITHC
jgi:hypothetical protein